MIPLRIYWHQFGGDPSVDRHRTLFNEILSMLILSGAYDYAERVCMMQTGPRDEFYQPTGKLEIRNAPNGDWDGPALRWLWNDAQADDFDCLYVHNKGGNWCEPPQCHLQDDWRIRLLTIALRDVDGARGALRFCDFTGPDVRWSEESSPMNRQVWAQGNIWWSKASYIRTLMEPPAYNWKPPYRYEHSDRCVQEFWIGNHGHANALALSEPGDYNPYKSRFALTGVL